MSNGRPFSLLNDEQMSNGRPFSLLNDEQMSNKVGVENQPDLLLFSSRSPGFHDPIWTLRIYFSNGWEKNHQLGYIEVIRS